MNTTLWSLAKALPQDRASFTWERHVVDGNVRYYNKKHKLYLAHRTFTNTPYNFREEASTVAGYTDAKAIYSIAASRYLVVGKNGQADQLPNQTPPHRYLPLAMVGPPLSTSLPPPTLLV